ncbi:hypothetical protein [Ruminiclostridium cellulolyticum]|uniref:Uncharacterized protein n=1 Tax=Ruminiclostridium cellulolyticum (strain ATCC 35319 / DSM 5812 / JCM 6584 / H10) TaxID=394503 RepID=B8I0E1_RUMCH|nr:hypothetical protein [Ruminiclostridium cellulolyticum]ACL77467.1 hypothetical protein Ccel_3176 [Ruminiclostridium cellulolyticum H10]
MIKVSMEGEAERIPQIYSIELQKEALGEFIKRVSRLSTWLRT